MAAAQSLTPPVLAGTGGAWPKQTDPPAIRVDTTLDRFYRAGTPQRTDSILYSKLLAHHTALQRPALKADTIPRARQSHGRVAETTSPSSAQASIFDLSAIERGGVYTLQSRGRRILAAIRRMWTALRLFFSALLVCGPSAVPRSSESSDCIPLVPLASPARKSALRPPPTRFRRLRAPAELPADDQLSRALRRRHTIVIAGPPNCGKTRLLFRLKFGVSVATAPTALYNLELIDDGTRKPLHLADLTATALQHWQPLVARYAAGMVYLVRVSTLRDGGLAALDPLVQLLLQKRAAMFILIALVRDGDAIDDSVPLCVCAALSKASHNALVVPVRHSDLSNPVDLTVYRAPATLGGHLTAIPNCYMAQISLTDETMGGVGALGEFLFSRARTAIPEKEKRRG